MSALVQAGLELFFNSNDHLPPHFHAERADEWGVRVFFLREPAEMLETSWQEKKPSKRTLRRLCAAAARVRDALLIEWEQRVIVSTPGKER
ncbi:MAG: DUF4160 domain-containing protein [Myxococcales bacterium]